MNQFWEIFAIFFFEAWPKHIFYHQQQHQPQSHRTLNLALSDADDTVPFFVVSQFFLEILMKMEIVHDFRNHLIKFVYLWPTQSREREKLKFHVVTEKVYCLFVLADRLTCYRKKTRTTTGRAKMI